MNNTGPGTCCVISPCELERCSYKQIRDFLPVTIVTRSAYKLMIEICAPIERRISPFLDEIPDSGAAPNDTIDVELGFAFADANDW